MTAKKIVAYKALRNRITHNRLAITDGVETELIAAGGAGVFRDLSFLVIANSTASTGVVVDIRDALAGTIRLTVNVDGEQTIIVPIPEPLPQAVANAAWTVQSSASISTLFVTAMAIDIEL